MLPQQGRLPVSGRGKEEFKLEAEEVFALTSVQITVEGRPHLGAPLGCTAYVSQFASQKVQQWSTELSEIASTQPHATFAALTHGLSSKSSYVTRTTSSIRHLIHPLDAILRSTLISNLTSRPPPNDIDLKLFALPVRLGGLGIIPPSAYADRDSEASLRVTSLLRDLLRSQDHVYSFAALDGQMSTRANIRRERRQQVTLEADSLRDDLTPTPKRAMNLWIPCMPTRN